MLLSGCAPPEKVVRHQIPKDRSGLDGIRSIQKFENVGETPSANQAPAPTVSGMEGWQAGKTNSMVPIRINKSFDQKQAEISVIPLPASANDWDSNVERWASQQLGLKLKAEELAERTTEVTVDSKTGNQVRLVEEGATGDKAIIGVMVVNQETAWFIKLMGDKEAVEKSETDFDKFISEFEFPGKAAPAAAEKPSKLLSGWSEGRTNSMVPIRINRSFENESAEISVIPLPAAANDWPSNVDRWASQQLGLKLNNDQLAELTTTVSVDGQPGNRVRLIDESSTNGKAIVGMMIVKGETAWFLKLMGERGAVEKAEADFDQFVDAFKIPD